MARARRRGFLSPAFLIRTKAVRSGILGNSRGWRLVAAFIFGRRLLKKIMGGVPQVVATETLQPGQFLSIRTIDPRTERR
ncbi:MAG: hypothetical protein M3487_01900 [Actinomycetota bacterium]|nr:hypothetical protein [Acidimicrobiia bacterium]MDQ3468520.1 hypothetical protein [Actinomycetota bacterium]